MTLWTPELAADEGGADDLRGLFSGEPSRDYRTMRMLVQILFDSGDPKLQPEERLRRTLHRLREAVSAPRACLYRVSGGKAERWLHDAPEGQPGPGPSEDAAAQAALGTAVADGRWAGRLRRDGELVGVLVVPGAGAAAGPGPAERALLDALVPQLSLLAKEGLAGRPAR